MISSDSQTQLTARWTSGGRNTTGFYIAYSASNTPAKCSGGLDIGNVTSYTRSDLDPDKAFFITVCAHDSQGNLSDGISAQQRTQPSDRFVPSASGLQIVSNSPQSLTMTWRSGGRNTAGFAVSFSATPTPAACGGVKIGNQLTYTRSDFDPNTTYSVTICAYDGQGNFSQPISMQGRTQPNNVFIPSPTNVLVEPIGRGGLVITWAPPFQYKPAGYSITFAPGANPPKCSGIKLGNVFSYTRTDLAPNTQYSVSICAYDERGNVSQPAGGTQITD
jgi:hypothetical protein